MSDLGNVGWAQKLGIEEDSLSMARGGNFFPPIQIIPWISGLLGVSPTRSSLIKDMEMLEQIQRNPGDAPRTGRAGNVPLRGEGSRRAEGT